MSQSIRIDNPEEEVPAVSKKKDDKKSEKIAEEDKEGETDFIQNMVNELLEEVTSEIEFNYQCGVCGKLFDTESQSQRHLDKDQGDCEKCEVYERKNKEHHLPPTPYPPTTYTTALNFTAYYYLSHWSAQYLRSSQIFS